MEGPAEIDARRVDAVVTSLCESVGGEWLLVGGALVALWLEPRRVTEDIDVVSLRGSADDRLALMRLASDLGLPVEAVNSAADFFVRRIPGWDRELELLREGARGRVHRPNATLFLLLKIPRLSATDLDDCTAAIERARRDGVAIDVGRVLAALDALPPAPDRAVEQRRRALRDSLR